MYVMFMYATDNFALQSDFAPSILCVSDSSFPKNILLAFWMAKKIDGLNLFIGHINH